VDNKNPRADVFSKIKLLEVIKMSVICFIDAAIAASYYRALQARIFKLQSL
jgi:hypothetical protein